MPGLVMFKRRWTIGSDDFVFPSIGEVVVRLSWVIALLVLYIQNIDSLNCHHGHNLVYFYLGTFVINAVSMVNTVILMCASMQGSIRNPKSRRSSVPVILYVKIFLLLPEFVWVMLSTYWMFGYSYSCDSRVVWTARGALITSWIVGFIMFFIFLAIFDPLGALKDRKNVQLSTSKRGDDQVVIANASATKIWESRCRLLCCCISGKEDTQQGFREVAKLVADFFHDLDLVPTDVLAGLVLVQKTQKNEDAELSAIVISQHQDHDTASIQGGASVSNIDTENEIPPKDWMTISNMSHYMKYAMGSYGWPFYMYENLFTGLCRLCSFCRCCSCCREGNGIFDDNCCQCNTAAIKKLSGAKECDLIYVTFHNKFKEIPFCVLVDKGKNTAVISIRGTLSLRDALADVSAEGAELEIPGIERSYCHDAMLDCATYIKTQVLNLRLLEQAFDDLERGARLVVTGHSLGAGVASILAVLMKPMYPDLMCFAFSPPGGLMSPSASRYSKNFVCSVVLGKDLVPRLGMYTLIDLKVKILKALAASDEPKCRILASGCGRMLCCKSSHTEGSGENQNSREVLMPQYMTDQQCVLEEALRSAEGKLAEIVNSDWPLYPAGQILHMMDVNEDQASCGSDPKFCAVWSSPEYFDTIVISHKMVMDHFPNAVNDALQQLEERNYKPSSRTASHFLRQASA